MNYIQRTKLFIGGLSLVGLMLFVGSCNDTDEEPVDIDELLTHIIVDPSSSKLTLKGNVTTYSSPYGTGYNFPQTTDIPECDQVTESYIELDSIGPIWENGFTFAAFVQFEEPRLFERIMDFGNGPGDEGGMNITFSRLQKTNHLGLSSWINSDSVLNRVSGRIQAFDVINEGQMMFVLGTISPEGTMAIYIDGAKAASKNNGHAVVNIGRGKNYIGRSNWCRRDPNFAGKMDGFWLFDTYMTEREATAYYKTFTEE